MTVVVGKIEPLKKLKEALNSNGIDRFNSIGEINAFLKNYESEKKEVHAIAKNSVKEEINYLREDLKKIVEKSSKSIIQKIFYYPKTKKLTKRISSLENDFETAISKRCVDLNQKLEFVKETVEGLSTVIAGAIGENLVVNKLQKLSDDHYLVNDFSIDFNPPIFNRKENDRIFSIQIDHLLICQSGVYAIETKNWSARSIQDLDLRSPVKQIKRSSYALFILLNSRSNLKLESHHWGSKKIPVRNIIVMTNKAPREEFKHVKVLSLDNLNKYIDYFDEIFTESETKEIFDYLKDQIRQNTEQ